ncbi:MAG: ATP-dependent 6-phosphofructokinase [Thermogutta sp.]
MRIGVLTSGGDAPGMNACIRSVVRSGLAAGHEVVGICRGYSGLLAEEFFQSEDSDGRMTLRSVSDIARRGGTILHTSRSQEFRTEAGLRKAADILRKHEIDALIPIGGDGTFHGAVALARFWDGRIVGCPGTIDNDLLGTDYTIGFATAVQTAVDAVDKLRDTADAHERMFLVEVMGRHCGSIALFSAIAGGAEIAAIPETPTRIDEIIRLLHEFVRRRKTSVMMIVAEGDERGGAVELQRQLQELGCPYETRVLALGHLQRGGSPVFHDRLLASRLGGLAVRSVLEGKTGVMAGEVGGRLVLTPFEETYAAHRQVDPEDIRLLEIMAT